MDKTVSMTWLSHLKEAEEQVELKQKVIQSEEVLVVLQRILTEKIKAARALQLARSRFMEASWSESQAELNGYQRALEEISSLINLER